MKEPIRKHKRTPMRKPNGLQWKLEDELRAKPSPEPQNVDNFPVVVGDPNINNLSPVEQEMRTLTPPTPPLPKPCLYENPATRETIRRKLKELEITNSNQLIRTYLAAELIEAISDFERALDDGFRVRHPTAYFRSLLK